jgi:hypothetical protein
LFEEDAQGICSVTVSAEVLKASYYSHILLRKDAIIGDRGTAKVLKPALQPEPSIYNVFIPKE